MYDGGMKNILIPADVPVALRSEYEKNYNLITQNSGRLMLFAGDQKVEHLNDDFYGEKISLENANPRHMFEIASKARIGVFATQLGLIARYGAEFPDIPYLVKLNSKTHLVKTEQAEPQSKMWLPVGKVVEFQKNSGLKIAAVGFTVYVGSENESKMLEEAAKVAYEAHQHGLITVFWMYPRGKAVTNEKDPHIVAGAAGVGACLGADFVKVNAPKKEGIASEEALKEAVLAAGETKLVCAGGNTTDAEKFLKQLYQQIHVGGASGNATGRNIHQRPLEEAVRLCNAIFAITIENKSVEEALAIYKG